MADETYAIGDALEDAVNEFRIALLGPALLGAIPKWGTVKARRAVRNCRISEAKTLGGLSPRQRGELAKELRP